MGPALKLVTQRLALGFILLFLVSILIFVGTLILPGDVAQSILGQSATPEALANLRQELGLNEPALTRYFDWLGGRVSDAAGSRGRYSPSNSGASKTISKLCHSPRLREAFTSGGHCP